MNIVLVNPETAIAFAMALNAGTSFGPKRVVRMPIGDTASQPAPTAAPKKSYSEADILNLLARHRTLSFKSICNALGRSTGRVGDIGATMQRLVNQHKVVRGVNAAGDHFYTLACPLGR